MLRFALALSATAALAACASGPMMMKPYDQSMLPAAVQVPAGNKVAMETVGAGDITYECRVTASSNGCSWAPTPS